MQRRSNNDDRLFVTIIVALVLVILALAGIRMQNFP